MAGVKVGIFSGYASSLLGLDKIRYLSKVKMCGFDPYEIVLSEFSYDMTKWPKVEYTDIVNYLVLTTCSLTNSQMKAYKSLESHNFFTSGFVDMKIQSKVMAESKVLLHTKVNHSQTLRAGAAPLLPWVLAKDSGEILTAHCSCMAGRGEACSHIGALLFALETGVRLRDSASCTGEPCKWLPAHVKNVPYLPVYKMDFSSSKAKKRLLDESVTCGVPQPAKVPQLTVKSTRLHSEAKRKAFLEEIASDKVESVILRVLPEYCTNFQPQASDSLPLPLNDLYSETNLEMDRVSLDAHCEALFGALQVTETMAATLENDSKQQSQCKVWFRQRAGRITASRLRQVCKTSVEKPSISLLKNVCYPYEHRFTAKATRWGCTHEQEARNKYEREMRKSHEGVVITDSGFHINPLFPFLGATPDGLVDCRCCGKGVCEVKCPWGERCSTVQEIADHNNHCLEKNQLGEATLKKDHKFYYQVQAQIFVCRVDYCDFVLWTENDLHVERILPDPVFWEGTLSTATKFFKLVVLPELAAHWYSRIQAVPSDPEISTSVTSQKVCFCNQPEEDVMAVCTNVACIFKKFHLRCLKMKIGPRSKQVWICPPCKKHAKAKALCQAQRASSSE